LRSEELWDEKLKPTARGIPFDLFRILDLQIEIANRVVLTAIARRPNPKNQMPSPNRIELVKVTSRLTLFCLTASIPTERNAKVSAP
jgi:hypothetical protein